MRVVWRLVLLALLGVAQALSVVVAADDDVTEGDRVTQAYKPLTVKVSAADNGFGFIVGERNGDLFIVTAYHVVKESLEQASRPRVSFFADKTREYSAEIIAREDESTLDLALLRVKKPAGLTVQHQPYCRSYSRGETAWWVGRDQEWDVPLLDETAHLKGDQPDYRDRIKFSGIGVRHGVSGAPLISRHGIIGLVVADAVNQGAALDVENVRRFVQEQGVWNLPQCGERPLVESTPPPKPPADCWEGWEDRKVCRDTLADGGDGPDMVLLAGGSFSMGSDGSEADGDEKPPVRTTVEAFAIARREVTRGEFTRFVEATGHRTEAEKGDGCFTWTGKEWKTEAGRSWRSPGFEQSDSHPVVCVSWNDAKAYATWISKEAGKSYRLPTEAEWEFAARAGSRTERFWGNDSGDACGYANVADQSLKRDLGWSPVHECDDGYVYTAPVGAFKANPFGLFDMLGNVWEWTCSVYEATYGGERTRCGSGGGDDRRVLRGGAWNSDPAWVRSANRGRVAPDNRGGSLGFRLARIP